MEGDSRTGLDRSGVERREVHNTKYDLMKNDLYRPHHNRRSIRLKGYDYSRAGAYFVTICAQNNGECLFGDIVGGEMVLNDAGRVVQAVWDDLPNHYVGVELDQYVIMPNHFHGIVVLGGPVGPKRHGLPEIIRGFKTFSSRRINAMRRTPGTRVWQRNYYERIIRDDGSMHRIRKYIADNPLKWELDLLGAGS